MRLQPSLTQQQVMKLTMTQELSQAIELLQYSAVELTTYLEEKALENPLIELRKKSEMTTFSSNSRSRNNNFNNEETNWIEQIGEQSFLTIHEHLMSQLNLKSLTAEKERIFNLLIDNLDENGYLRASVSEIATSLSVSECSVTEMVVLLQQLEPRGIGAKNLQQCLLLQLTECDETSLLAKEIITSHFIDFAEKNWRAIAKNLNITLTDIQIVYDFVQTLNPRPGAMFTRENSSYVVPDAIVEFTGDRFIVKVVDDHLPAISYNNDYYSELQSYQNSEVAEFLREKTREVNWIMRSIQQRNETLTRVVTKIIEKQRSFFQNQSGQLQPLTMKEVADELEIHESTVSRTVREKYVQTPFGTYALKSFFTSALNTVAAGEMSSDQVKQKISEIIADEDKYKPLSDQKIANFLKENNGVVISRRTVAKYRDELGIPSSTKRKRF